MHEDCAKQGRRQIGEEIERGAAAVGRNSLRRSMHAKTIGDAATPPWFLLCQRRTSLLRSTRLMRSARLTWLAGRGSFRIVHLQHRTEVVVYGDHQWYSALKELCSCLSLQGFIRLVRVATRGTGDVAVQPMLALARLWFFSRLRDL